MEKIKISFSFFMVFIGGLLSIIGVLFLRILNSFEKKFDDNDHEHRRIYKMVGDIKEQVDKILGRMGK